MKSPLGIFAEFVELIYQCKDLHDLRRRMLMLRRRDYTSDVSTQPNISMSHDNFDIKVTYDVPVPTFKVNI